MAGITPDTGIDVSSLASSASLFMTAQLQIINPSGGTAQPYDFTTNTGGRSTGSIIWTGPGRVHSLHSTRGFNLPGNYDLKQTLARVIYFQIPLTSADGGYDGQIERGWFVRVLSGGDDPTLTDYRFVVESSVNNSIFPTRTINTIVDFEVVPAWQ